MGLKKSAGLVKQNKIWHIDKFIEGKRVCKSTGTSCSINLMAYVIISKYAHGLPLYRMEKILKRYGGDITRATLANWVIHLARQLQPLINLLREHQLSGDIIQMDETTVKVLKEPDKPLTSDKYMWVSRGGPPGKNSILFEYDSTRASTVPLRLLDDFSGYLQTDGLTGKALTYTNNQWKKLIVYYQDGRLNISNVLAENAIRPFVIGRKAWLFSNSPKGASASSVHYSLIETAKANNVKPYAYLVHVLNKIPYADTVKKIEALLPWNYKKLLIETAKIVKGAAH